MSTNPVYQFNDDARSVRINRSELPTPWINYLSNGRLHAFVSQAGGGLAWWKSPITYRMTHYRYQNVPMDGPGFYTYIREKDGTTWSPSYRPCETPLDDWHAEHHAGWSEFEGTKNGVTAKLKLFCAMDTDALCYEIEIKNQSEEEKELDLFAYADLAQLEWTTDLFYGYYIQSQVTTFYEADMDAIIYRYQHTPQPFVEDVPLIWMAADRKMKSWSGDREKFIGPYRWENNPVGVERGHCGNDTIECGHPCAAGHVSVTLAPGESDRICFTLGVAPGGLVKHEETLMKIKEDLSIFRDFERIDEQFGKLERWWANHIDKFQCEIPAEEVERQINTWTPIQTVHNARYSRSISWHAPGFRGFGYRDTATDMIGIAYRDPAWAKEMCLYLLSQQFEDGHAVHACYPEEGGGDYHGSHSKHADDHLWMPMVVYAILAETGDLSLLDEKVTWLSLDDRKSAVGSDSVWDHLMRGVEFTENNLGSKGFPLTFDGDWNDIILRFSRAGKGESVFCGQQYVIILRQMLEMGGLAEKPSEDLIHLQSCLDRMVSNLEQYAWDGDYWRRGFTDEGDIVGTKDADFGNIFINPQSWSIWAGVGTDEQNNRAMDCAIEQTKTDFGLRLLYPGFKTYPNDPDPFTGYNPGCAENGAVFCQANGWAILALTKLGRADDAWKIFNDMIPHNALRHIGFERYEAEPYAYASNVIGPENKRCGWANVTQVTGTAAWMDVVGTQYLLGVRPTLLGLMVDPCIPADWKEYRVVREFRGVQYRITVLNPDGVVKGVKAVKVNGQLMEGQVIDPSCVGSEGEIEVVMGVK
jgi:cellobiose phosphorylase